MDQGFTNECVADLCDLRAVINKLETLDASLRGFRRRKRTEIVIGSLPAKIPSKFPNVPI